MIGKINRFHGHNSLNIVYKRGKAVNVSQVSLKYSPARPGRQYRLAVVVSRKVSKSAVTRNRIRRRLYEAVRTRVASLPGVYDLVINVYNEQLANMSAEDLNSIVEELLSKAGFLSNTAATDHAIVNRQRENN